MSKHHIEIRRGERLGHQALIDGTDIACSLAGLTLRLDKDALPRLELDLLGPGIAECSDLDAQLIVSQGAAETLRALGWTPPADQP
ncbi:hypothetical protein OOK29_26015 [Streptomyces phaeochromogenes]|uniref:hypothetical protein n=1 Tax=Streptomyces phaeochromogenes TaxID=1923 RepID=UPI0022508115|nr:hypothetical protein [Streptomyces phaeochromogenes]MCX5601611.1 hypothetical protein [Streptomyces phaeochromogenes]